MQDIKIREEKMKAKRMETPFRDFVKEMCSRYGFLFTKEKGQFTNHAPAGRMKLVDIKTYEDIRSWFTNLWIEYNPETSLRDQMTTLLQTCGVPDHNLIGTTENVQFSDCIWDAKNVYLSYVSGESISNVLYSLHVKIYCNNVLNSVMVWDGCDIVYQSTGIIKSYKVFYSKYIYSSNNIRFCTNMMSCSECMFCDGLSNASYCIRNQQFTEEEYQEKKQELLSQKQLFETRYKEIAVAGQNLASANCKGNFIIKSTNVENGINAYQINNGRNIINAWGAELDENIVDCCLWGTPAAKDNYFCNMFGGWDNNYGWWNSYYWSNNYYCIYCDACSYCLGCVGLKNRQFCILNKEYSKEERFILANKIFKNMEADWTLWQFFPWSMSPFYFNDSFAYLIDDTFTKEEVSKEWYLRRDEGIKVDIPQGADVVETKDLSSREWFENWTWKINPEILKKVIRDEKWNYYRIVPMELDFLQKHGLPLPEIHWLERIKLGFKFK